MLFLSNWLLGGVVHIRRAWKSSRSHPSCSQGQLVPSWWPACWQGRWGGALDFRHQHIDLELPNGVSGTSKPARSHCLCLGFLYVRLGRTPAGAWGLASSLAPWPRHRVAFGSHMGEGGAEWWGASTATSSCCCSTTRLPLRVWRRALPHFKQPVPQAPPALPHLGAAAPLLLFLPILEACSCSNARSFPPTLTIWLPSPDTTQDCIQQHISTNIFLLLVDLHIVFWLLEEITRRKASASGNPSPPRATERGCGKKVSQAKEGKEGGQCHWQWEGLGSFHRGWLGGGEPGVPRWNQPSLAWLVGRPPRCRL